MKTIKIPVENDVFNRLSDEALGAYIRILAFYSKHRVVPKNVGVLAGIIMSKPTVVQEVLDSGLFGAHPKSKILLYHADLERQMDEHKTPIVIQQPEKEKVEQGVDELSAQERKINGQMLLGINIEQVKKEEPKRKHKKAEKTDYTDTCIAILTYFNQCTGFEYRTDIQSNHSPITALLRKKYTEDDIRMVIEAKTREWLNTEMQKYLRPETIFGKKFDGYLNQARNPFTKANKTAQQFFEVGEIKFED